MDYPNRPNYDQNMDYRRCQNCPCPRSQGQGEWHGSPWNQMSQPRQPMMPWQMAGQIPQPMPYHMAYPYPLFMQGEDDDERDLEKLKSMFPENARIIQPIIEDECDRMEYDGSLMFDEYPDRVMMERMVDKIYQRMQNSASDDTMGGMQTDSMYATQCKNCGGRHLGDGLQDLISVMLFEEMHRRRCRHRRCKRWW